MFSDFVNFKDVVLLVDGKQVHNCGLVSLDITHDNEVYQLFLASIGEYAETINITEYLNEQISKGISVCINLEYELRKTGGTIVDLYRVIPENNRWLTVCKNKDNDIFILKCRLLARNNVNFDYDNITKVVNF